MPRSGDETLDRLRVRTLGPARQVRGQAANPFSLSLFAALGGADVVHCHQQHVVASSAAALFGRLTRRPVFVTDLGGGGWDVSAYLPTDRWFAGHLHISAYSRHVSGHDGKLWARVVGGGVDTTRFSPDPAAPRTGSALFVGRLLPHKGVDVLLRAAPADLPVEIVGASGALLASSRITFISPQVDNTTQTVLAKVQIANTKDALRTSQFIRARVIWGRQEWPVVPVIAVSRIGGLYFAFVAEPDQKGGYVVHQRPIQVGQIIGNDYVVLGGIKTGDKVVVSGTQFLIDGIPVVPQESSS